MGFFSVCLKALYGRRNGTIGQIQRPERQRKEAPGSDKGLLRIVEWLKEYGVPISFVPFTLHAGEAGTDDADILLEIWASGGHSMISDPTDDEKYLIFRALVRMIKTSSGGRFPQ